MKEHLSFGEHLFKIFNAVFMVFWMCITLYPFLYVFFVSVSNPADIAMHTGILFKPAGFNLIAYKAVVSNKMVIYGYRNTLFYVLTGTALNVFMTSLAAFVLSRKNVYWKNAVMFMIVFTMYFHGGLIPNYLLVQKLGFMNSWKAIIIPTAISTYNTIIMRTSFQSIPDSLEESAKIDGANDLTVLFRIILPLSKPVISVMVLFYGVSNWNRWFEAMIYLTDRKLYPLQLVLREIVLMNQTQELTMVDNTEGAEISETIKYATIMAATLPILCIYPFLQKYFVKGVMIGALKG